MFDRRQLVANGRVAKIIVDGGVGHEKGPRLQ